jgi:hypothetical protein
METLLVHQDVIEPMIAELKKLPGMATVAFHACPISWPHDSSSRQSSS